MCVCVYGKEDELALWQRWSESRKTARMDRKALVMTLA
jgi:hypothetical protein